MAKSSTPSSPAELIRPDTTRDYFADVLSFVSHEPAPERTATGYIEHVPQEVFYRVLDAAGTVTPDEARWIVHWLYQHFMSEFAITAVLDRDYSIVGFHDDVMLPKLAKPGVVNLRSMPYEDFLKTEHWMRVRTAALDRADHRCQLCNDDDRLEVHHRTYERRGNERDSDVIVLCHACHSKFHGIDS